MKIYSVGQTGVFAQIRANTNKCVPHQVAAGPSASRCAPIIKTRSLTIACIVSRMIFRGALGKLSVGRLGTLGRTGTQLTLLCMTKWLVFFVGFRGSPAHLLPVFCAFVGCSPRVGLNL